MSASYSFVIPAYNDAPGLRRHLAYFAQQTDRIQLIIVDDCSQDDTSEVIASANLPDNVTLTYHRMDENAGPAAARNMGVTLAEHDWLLFLDADDLLTYAFFDTVRCLPERPNFDFAMFKHHLSMNPDQPHSYMMHQRDQKFFSRRDNVKFPMDHYHLSDCPDVMGTVNFPWNKLYRRQFLIDADIRFPDLRMHEDVTPHWHSFLRCDSFAVLGWAPPLITHYEIAASGRATQYVGERRLGVFDELFRIEQEIRNHAMFDQIGPVFADFCDDLFAWMRGPLCDQGGKEGAIWRPRYAEAEERFRAQSRILDQEVQQ